MKIVTSKNILYLALSRIQTIVEKSSIMPITANALLTAKDNCLTISATNLEIGMLAHYQNITVINEGTISINAKKLFEIIRELPEEDITISEKENYHIDIISNKVRFTILALPPEDFPVFFTQETTGYKEWEIEKIKNMIDATSFSISNDETRINIAGAYMEKLDGSSIRMVTTDGYRLSMIDEDMGIEVPFNEGLLIPHKGITELRKILGDKKEEKKLLIKIIKNSVSLKIAEIEIFIRLIDKKFPEYRYIIPQTGENEVVLTAEKEKVKAALKRMSIIASDNKRPVNFKYKNKTLEISTEDSELGSVNEIIEMEETAQKEFFFSINGKYFLDVFNAVEEDVKIEINSADKNKPIVIHPCVKVNTTYIIMPMMSE